VLHADSDCPDLAASAAAPATGVTFARPGLDSECVASGGQGGFEGSNERPNQQTSVGETDDRVGSQLAGAVVRNLTAPFGRYQFDLPGG
jgi:hypothetical protein